MFNKGFVLTTRHHLEAAMFNQSNVEVWQHGQIIDYGGRIENLSRDSITINGGKYLIDLCEFRIR